MTELEIQCLKDNIDRFVEIETTEGELIVAKVISVFHDEDHDEHELFYEIVSTNMPEWYKTLENSGGFALDFSSIMSVKPHAGARS